VKSFWGRWAGCWWEQLLKHVFDLLSCARFVTWIIVLHRLLTQKMFPIPSTLNIRETMPTLWTETLSDFTDCVKLVLGSTCLCFQTPSNAEAQTALHNKCHAGTCCEELFELQHVWWEPHRPVQLPLPPQRALAASRTGTLAFQP